MAAENHILSSSKNADQSFAEKAILGEKADSGTVSRHSRLLEFRGNALPRHSPDGNKLPQF